MLLQQLHNCAALCKTVHKNLFFAFFSAVEDVYGTLPFFIVNKSKRDAAHKIDAIGARMHHQHDIIILLAFKFGLSNKCGTAM